MTSRTTLPLSESPSGLQVVCRAGGTSPPSSAGCKYAAQNAATVSETMARARAAGELGNALQVLDDQQGRR
ncbi:MAG: hypothetical protein ACR2JO_07325 [Mycobacteriales bacterium]